MLVRLPEEIVKAPRSYADKYVASVLANAGAVVMSPKATMYCLILVFDCSYCRADPLVGDGTMRGVFENSQIQAPCRNLGISLTTPNVASLDSDHKPKPMVAAVSNWRKYARSKESGESYKR